jgi:GGDEF domain-containing protein
MFTHNPLQSRLLLEDYMAMLRGLVGLAWVAFALAVITQLTIRASSSLVWPEDSGFALVFNIVLIEFGLNTLALTALLFYPNWYERIPRESAQRVRWLLLTVIFWFSVHLFAAFHITGALDSPLLLMLPVLLVAALVAFPGLVGWLLASYLLLGHLTVLAMERSVFIAPHGVLSQQFSLHEPVSILAASAVGCVLFIAVLLASVLRQWMYPSSQSLSLAQRIDSDSGLFRRVFLEHRVDMELGRIRRQGGSATLLLISIDQVSRNEVSPEVASALIRQVRLGSDTPAIYQPGVVAVLLPTAGPEAVKGIVRRIVGGVSKAMSESDDHGPQIRAAAALASGHMESARLRALAEEALERAVAGGDPVIVSG